MKSLFRRAYTPLSTRSSTLPLNSTPSPTVRALQLIRSRSFFSVILSIASLFIIVSLFTSTSLLGIFSSSSHRRPHFNGNGLKTEMWKELDAIPWRSVVLEPTTEDYAEETSQDMPVPWSNYPFLPRTPLVQADGSKTPIPSHRIKVLPRTVELTREQEERTEPDRLMFGTVTTVARAKVISELWSRWLVPVDEQHSNITDIPSIDHELRSTVPSPAEPSFPENETDFSTEPIPAVDSNRPICLILVSNTEKPKEIDELRSVLKRRGMNCHVRVSTEPRYEIRVLSMVREMKTYAASINRKFDWYIFGDDDTFWLDLRTLRRMLAKYDSKKDYFVGAPSEAKAQIDSFGRMAFGGAGILVSDALMLKMYTIWDECHDRFKHVFGGDEMLTRCAALAKGSNKQSVTTEEKGLHQFDIPGDTTGVFQSGIPFVTLHHYLGGAWVHIFGYGTYMDDMEQIRLIKRVVGFLGGDNMFKRYVFGDGKWLLTNGYSLTLFEGRGLGKPDLALMEHTWYDGYRLSYEDRPLVEERHAAPGTLVKQTFYIDDIRVLSPSSAILVYAQADKWDEHLSKVDRVRIEVLWDGCWNDTTSRDCINKGAPVARAE